MLAAVVVTYSAAPATLRRCVASVRPEVDRLVVVDTGGRAEPGPDAVLVRRSNRGYGAAANEGFRRCLELGATAIALFNDDVEVEPGWASAALAELDAARVGAVQPVLVGLDGVTIGSLGVVVGPDGAGTDAGDGLADTPDHRGPNRDIAAFTGGAVVFSAEFLRDTGGFDERWFLYYEDVDLARRGARLGWRYRLVTDATVRHDRGSSTSARPGWTRYLQERNRLLASVRFADRSTVRRAFWLSVRRLRHAPRGVHAGALAAGLVGTPRQLWRRWRGRDRVGPLRSRAGSAPRTGVS